MITLHKYEGKNKEELLEQCLEKLNTDSENIYYTEKCDEGGLFKGKKYTIEVVTKEEIKQYIKEFIEELGNKMNIDLKSEIRFTDENINILLVSDNNAILIGKDGKNLDAIQLLIRQSVNSYGLKFRITLDAGNYKSKKLKNLEFEIKKVCKEVISSKVEVKLDPMNSYERRIVHSIVGEYENLESSSYGEGKERYTVIKCKD